MKRFLTAVLTILMLCIPLSGYALTDATMFSLIEPEFTITLQEDWVGASYEFFSKGMDEYSDLSWDEWKKNYDGSGVILEAIKCDETNYMIVYTVPDNTESDWDTYTDEDFAELVEYDINNMSYENQQSCFNVDYLRGEGSVFLIEDYFYDDSEIFVRNAYTQKNGMFYEITFMGYMTEEDVYPTEYWDEALYFTKFIFTKAEGDLPIVLFMFVGILLIRIIAVAFGTVRQKRNKKYLNEIPADIPDNRKNPVISYLTKEEKTGSVTANDIICAESDADWLAQEIQNESNDINLKL